MKEIINRNRKNQIHQKEKHWYRKKDWKNWKKNIKNCKKYLIFYSGKKDVGIGEGGKWKNNVSKKKLKRVKKWTEKIKEESGQHQKLSKSQRQRNKKRKVKVSFYLLLKR